MAFILRILRAIMPLVFFYFIGKVLRNFIAVYQYQNSRGRTGSNSREESRQNGQGNGRSFYGRENLDPYELLECSRSSSNEEIKKSYRKLIAKYHPDRFVGMSLDDEFVKLASEKFQTIQSAYDSIRNSRGF